MEKSSYTHRDEILTELNKALTKLDLQEAELKRIKNKLAFIEAMAKDIWLYGIQHIDARGRYEEK